MSNHVVREIMAAALLGARPWFAAPALAQAAPPESAEAYLFVFGNVYYTLARHETALPLYEESLRVRRSLHGNMHPDVATSLYGLASAHLAMNDREIADSLYTAWGALTERLPE